MGVCIGYDLPVLLPGHGQDVQLCLYHLWLGVGLRNPLLVLHTPG